MDDLVTLAEGVRSVLAAGLPAEAAAHANQALDAVVEVYRWHRRLGGDTRRRNRFLAFIYKGA
jgi:predicted amidohydrolase YtcJ